MSMTEWAKREVEIACKREREGNSTWGYGAACYESALKAFESLMEDGHSGFSIKLTQGILNRLINGRPLTPIEDTEDIWEDVDGLGWRQCKRMRSFFKKVDKNGNVTYDDLDRFVCYNISKPNIGYHSGCISEILNKMFPIEMPYFPSEKSYRVICSDFLYDKHYGDFDTIRMNIISPDGVEQIPDHNIYLKETDDGFVEIDFDEFVMRYENRVYKESGTSE